LNRFAKSIAFVVLIALLGSILALAGCSSPKSTDKVVAEVNGVKIYNSELERQVQAQLGNHMDQFQGAEGQKMLATFKAQILDMLIDNELIVQEAKKKGFKVSKKEIDDRIKEIRGQFKSDQEYKAALQQAGLTESDVPRQVERMIYAEKLLADLFKGVKATDKEIEDYYKKNEASFIVPESVKLSHIFSTSESTATKALEAIKGGMPFEEAVSKYSEDLATLQLKGDLGTQTATTLQQGFGDDFAKAVMALKAGEVSKVIKSAMGYHIVKVFAKIPQAKKTLAEAKNDIILQVENAKKQEIYTKWIAEIKKKAKIKKYL
jgi:parvulin-like peptidyl-prolyl isomerase